MAEIDPSVLAMVAKKLDSLGVNYTFVGGAVVGFLLDNVRLSPVRPTDDLDIIVEVAARWRYSDIEQRLRDVGFTHDTRNAAPMCRWLLHGVTIDIMPTKGNLIGLNTDWFSEALETSTIRGIGPYKLKIIAPVAFIATKLAAFRDRGRNDYQGSHDLEDLMTVIDGREEMVQEIKSAPASLRDFIVASIEQLCREPDFEDALSGYLPPDAASQKRLPALRQKLATIASLKDSRIKP